MYGASHCIPCTRPQAEVHLQGPLILDTRWRNCLTLSHSPDFSSYNSAPFFFPPHTFYSPVKVDVDLGHSSLLVFIFPFFSKLSNLHLQVHFRTR